MQNTGTDFFNRLDYWKRLIENALADFILNILGLECEKVFLLEMKKYIL